MKVIVCALVLLTTPDGKPVWIETEHIVSVRRNHTHCAPNSNALLRLDSNSSLCVIETPEQIYEKERAR